MKYIKISLLIIGVVLNFGCSDFLDKKPLGLETVESLYSTEEGIKQALNTAYAHLGAWEMCKTSFQAITEISSDDTDPGSNMYDPLALTLLEINDFKYTTSQDQVYWWYSTNYAGINRCNQVIDNVPNSPADPEIKSYITAQARFLRAHYFLNLIKAYGDIPKVDRWITDPKEYTRTPKTSENDMYQFVIDELIDIERILHSRKQLIAENEVERVCREAAWAYLSKIYLTLQDYVNAKKYAKLVMDTPEFSLHPDFKLLFWQGTNSCESIFDGQFKWASHRDHWSYPNSWIDFMGVRENGRGWGFIAPTDDLYNAFDPNDPRRDITIFRFPRTLIEEGDEPINWEHAYYKSANGKTLIPKRLYHSNCVYLADINPHYLRLADIILVYAESCNELGETDEALRALEQIRFRARGNKSYDSEVALLPEIKERDKFILRHLIWNERRFELALENHRFFDLMRYEKIEPGYATKVMHTHGKLNFNYVKHNHFPIPETEISFTGGAVEQNPAWK